MELLTLVVSGAVVGAVAGGAMRDVRAALGGGALGTAAGWVVYALIRIDYWVN